MSTNRPTPSQAQLLWWGALRGCPAVVVVVAVLGCTDEPPSIGSTSSSTEAPTSAGAPLCVEPLPEVCVGCALTVTWEGDGGSTLFLAGLAGSVEVATGLACGGEVTQSDVALYYSAELLPGEQQHTLESDTWSELGAHSVVILARAHDDGATSAVVLPVEGGADTIALTEPGR